MSTPPTSPEYWLSAHTVGPYLTKVGVKLDLDSASARELRGRHLCFHVRDRQQSYFIKQYDDAMLLGWAVIAERYVEAGRSSGGEIFVDKSRSIVVSPWQTGRPFQHKLRDRSPHTRASALVTLLNELQRNWEILEPMRQLGIRNASHWTATLLHPHVESLRYFSTAQLELLRVIQGSEVLNEALIALNTLWSPQVVLHGDIRSENVLADRNEMAIVDWETVQLGPRSWDLACVTAMVLLQWLLLHNSEEALGYRKRSAEGRLGLGDISLVAQRGRTLSSERESNVMLTGALLRIAFEGAANTAKQTFIVDLLVQMAINISRDGMSHFVG